MLAPPGLGQTGVWRGEYPATDPPERRYVCGTSLLLNRGRPLPEKYRNPLVVEIDPLQWDYWWAFHRDEVMAERLPALLGERARPTPAERKHIRESLLVATKESDPAARSAAAVALARMGASTEELAALLQDPDAAVREAAVLALGLCGDRQALVKLREVLERPTVVPPSGAADADRTDLSRSFAACALARLVASRPDQEDRREVARLLQRLACLPEETADDRVVFLVALGSIPLHDSDALALALLPLLVDPDQAATVRAAAALALAKLLARAAPTKLADAAARLLLQLADEESGIPVELRQACFLALGRLAPGCRQPTLVRISRACMSRVESRGGTRSICTRFAFLTLAEVSAVPAIPGTLREAILLFLVRHVERGSTGQRSWAGLALGQACRLRALPPNDPDLRLAQEVLVLRFRKESDPAEKGAFAIALGLARAPLGVEPIAFDTARSKHAAFRGHCDVALALLAAQGERERITKAAVDSIRQPVYARHAALAVGQLGGLGADTALRRILAGPEPGLAQHVRVAAALALGALRDESWRPLLAEVKASSPESSELRPFLIGALGLRFERPGSHGYRALADGLDHTQLPPALIDPERPRGLFQRL